MQSVTSSRNDLLEVSLSQGQKVLSRRTDEQRKENGQYFTPVPIARFMALQLPKGARILDPATGSGVLSLAVIENTILRGEPKEIWIDGFEVDPELCKLTNDCLSESVKKAAKHGIKVHVNIYNRDFIFEGMKAITPSLLLNDPSVISDAYDCIISNPPYFKLNIDNPRVKAVNGMMKGHTNIYTLFMAISLRLLKKNGLACFIVPRSFCSGAYFSGFRRDFLEQATPISVHLFDSRVDTFKADEVLQENIIIAFRKKLASEKVENEYLRISTSKNIDDLSDGLISKMVSLRSFIGRPNGDIFFRLPVGDLDEEIINAIDNWQGSLKKYGFDVSTGPVVSFRSRQSLTDSYAVSNGKAFPLLLLNNVKKQEIQWPLSINKPQGIALDSSSSLVLVKSDNFVILRRFSAKEEERRLVAAPLLREDFNYPLIGIENHLNFIYKRNGGLEKKEAIGLSALYNSSLFDRYFRIANGNTQVNATELRALPLPSIEVIRDIGDQLYEAKKNGRLLDLDSLVVIKLREFGFLPPDFPTIKETRIKMGKIQQAQEILKTLGLPSAQQNEISALTLLVLAGLTEEGPWSDVIPVNLRIHDILIEFQNKYDRVYAENSRETVRRKVIHQFIQAGLVSKNYEDPTLPTNSPNTRYILTEAAVQVIKKFQTNDWEKAVKSFRQNQGSLLDLYRRSREHNKIPLVLPSGEQYFLSPGKHNRLELAVITEFGPRFTPSAVVLYVGDTEFKSLHLNVDLLNALNIPVSSHDKLPDIVLYEQGSNRLFLIEVVTAHGPVSPKRYNELELMLQNTASSRVYVSAFPDFKEFKRHLTDIAWETEVWIAEIPDHMIHFNGDHFL